MITRRDVIRKLPAAAFAGSAIVGYRAANAFLVYIGTYTRGGSQGIYTYRFNPATGALAGPELAAETPNPSFLTIHSSRDYLYAVNELSTFREQKSGSVTAFRCSTW